MNKQSANSKAGTTEFNGGSKVLGAGDLDDAIIVANGKKIYVATFPISMMRSFYHSGAYLIKDLNGNKGIIITSYIGNKKEDKRYNEKLHDTLKEMGILIE